MESVRPSSTNIQFYDMKSCDVGNLTKYMSGSRAFLRECEGRVIKMIKKASFNFDHLLEVI